ncbi:DNA replication complex subunit Gins51 [Candidatus Hodarchaeum mangrovi]
MDYIDLLDLWRKERKSHSLQKIPSDFYISIDSELAKIYRTSSEVQWRELNDLIIERFEFLRQDLTKLRLQKILNSIINELPIETAYLTWGEQKLVENLQKSINTLSIEKPNFYTQDISLNMSLQEDPDQDTDQIDKNGEINNNTVTYITVRILADTDQFIGTDNRRYGPLKKHNVAYLPLENAKALIAKSVARIIENNTRTTSSEIQ